MKILIFVLCFVTINSLEEGDDCTLENSNLPGICTPISKCDIAKDVLNMRDFQPQMCTYTAELITCCPKTEDIDDEKCAYPPNAITVPKNEYPHKAWNKCIDLADVIYPCNFTYFTANAQKHRASICKYEAAEYINGGNVTKPDEFPHMAALGFVSDNVTHWDCGGTLISEEWIMTAAHCLFHPKEKVAVSKVRLGTNNLKTEKDPQFLFDVIEMIKHPNYTTPPVYNDIALLKIDRPVVYSVKIIPACLHVGNNVSDTEAIATGYGTDADKVKSDQLMKVKLTKFTKEDCINKITKYHKIKFPNNITDTQMCYGSKDGKDTCTGDSGGPLQIRNTGVHCTFTVIGVTSTGLNCGIAEYPGVYTKVSAFVPWIESIVWPN